MQSTITDFQQTISWSQENYTHLPWRQERSLYRALVAEMMLQQTTVNTVISRYQSFLHVFPTAKYLARANEDEVLLQWQGLGYYRRARYLHRAAKIIVATDEQEVAENLKQLPGVGEYTAQALSALVYEKKVLSFDVNVRRVLSRYFDIDENLLNQNVLPVQEFNAGNLNEAIMDVGRNFCRANRVDCHACPLKICASRGKPKFVKKKQKKLDIEVLRLLYINRTEILLVQRPDNFWLSGQWELPSFFTQDYSLAQYPRIPKNFQYQELEAIKSAITRYKISNILAKSTIEVKGSWVRKDNLDKLPLSSVTRRLLRLVPEAGLEPARF